MKKSLMHITISMLVLMMSSTSASSQQLINPEIRRLIPANLAEKVDPALKDAMLNFYSASMYGDMERMFSYVLGYDPSDPERRAWVDRSPIKRNNMTAFETLEMFPVKARNWGEGFLLLAAYKNSAGEAFFGDKGAFTPTFFCDLWVKQNEKWSVIPGFFTGSLSINVEQDLNELMHYWGTMAELRELEESDKRRKAEADEAMRRRVEQLRQKGAQEKQSTN